jgi:hypothetical protein
MLLILFGQNTNLTFCLTYRAGQLGWPGPHANPVMDGALLVSLSLNVGTSIAFPASLPVNFVTGATCQ